MCQSVMTPFDNSPHNSSPPSSSPHSEPLTSRVDSETAPQTWRAESRPLWIEAGNTEQRPPLRRRGIWLIAVAALVLGGYHWTQWQQNHTARPTLVGPIEVGETTAVNAAAPAATVATTRSPLIEVHVVGKVKRPGVYQFSPNARVHDAVAKAGGAAADADLNALNLAAWLEDGKQIEVPARESATNGPGQPRATKEDAKSESAPSKLSQATRPKPSATRSRRNQSNVPPLRSTSRRSAASAKRSQEPDRIIDLNRASAEELELLPGIGPAIAARIVQYREENGDFGSVDELDEVKGIGEKKLEKLRSFIAVR